MFISDGYFQHKNFIATQAPLIDTVEDLWRMMYEQRSVTLITLNDFDDPGLPVFWPDQEREWHEWSIDEGRMVLAKTEMETEIAVIKTMDGAAWEGSEGRISKRMFQVFSYADKNEHEVTHESLSVELELTSNFLVGRARDFAVSHQWLDE